MADIVIVGAGLGGLAAAARLAKLGHQVTVCERNGFVGGALHTVERDGFGWDAGPSSFTLPAVLRDLFRKSGRPIERYLDLQMCTPARRHVFADGSSVDLPTGSRAAQSSAVEAGLGVSAARAWTAFCDAQGEVWETLRTAVLDVPDAHAALSSKRAAKRLRARTSLARTVRRALPDPRLRRMAELPFVRAGSQPRQVPAYGAAWAYVERTFGVWRVAGGTGALVAALRTRLEERKVTLRLRCPVAAIRTANGRIAGVRTEDGESIPADIVVTDVDIHAVCQTMLDSAALDSTVAAAVASATPAPAPTVTHLGLSDPPDLRDGSPRPGVAEGVDEVVFHGDPLVVLTTRGYAPAGHQAWTVQTHRSDGGPVDEDVLSVLARRGVDVRRRVVTRVDRSAAAVAAETGGSPYGVAWSGWRDQVRRARLGNPLPGLYCLGASTPPGAGVPYVAWGAAHVAERIGKAGASPAAGEA